MVTCSQWFFIFYFFISSSGDECSRDAQVSIGGTKTHTPISHPQPFARVPRPPHLHQNSCEPPHLSSKKQPVCFGGCFLKAPVSVLQTFREPVSDYQVLREKAASQRRDVERALTRFMAKTGETQSLFKDDVTAFPREPL